MASIIEELLRPIVRSFLTGQTHALCLKMAHWLDANVPGKAARLILGMLLGLVTFFSAPIVTGLLGF
jgi:hypothetical protein